LLGENFFDVSDHGGRKQKGVGPRKGAITLIWKKQGLEARNQEQKKGDELGNILAASTRSYGLVEQA